jgi:succinate dehydrogenase/fumarate reductase flavoprotein subunit
LLRLKACLDRGVIVHTISRVVKLIVKNDRVIGVETQSARFSANRAVILASGGFEQNAEMVAEFLPAPMEHLPTPPGLATGDNVDLALQVGAALDRMDTSWNWPSSQIPGKEYEGSAIGDLMLGERMLPHSLWVNKHGERFCNEAAHNVAFAFEQRDAQGSLLNVPAWAILDSQYRAKYPLLFKYMPGSKDPGWLIKGWHPWRASGKDRSRCRSATANHFSLQCKRTGRKGSGLRPRAKWL